MKNNFTKVTAHWEDQFLMEFDGLEEHEKTLSISEFTIEVNDTAGCISFRLVSDANNGRLGLRVIRKLQARLDAFRESVEGLKNCFYAGSTNLEPVEMHLNPEVVLGFTTKGRRASDAIMDRFLQTAKHLQFKSKPNWLKWGPPTITRTTQPYVGTVPLGVYLAKRRYPIDAR